MKNKIIGGIVLFLLALGFVVYQNKNEQIITNEKEIFVEDAFETTQTVEKKIIVCITGEIVHPGTYEMTQGCRVKDLVDVAGGFKDSSETSRLNLARKLIDEDLVVIPEKQMLQKESLQENSEANVKTKSLSLNDNNKINLNTATIQELDSIPGIGKITAEKIIQYRDKKGFFSKIEELMEVDRIGEATFNKIKDYVEIY